MKVSGAFLMGAFNRMLELGSACQGEGGMRRQGHGVSQWLSFFLTCFSPFLREKWQRGKISSEKEEPLLVEPQKPPFVTLSESYALSQMPGPRIHFFSYWEDAQGRILASSSGESSEQRLLYSEVTASPWAELPELSGILQWFPFPWILKIFPKYP